MKNRMVFSSLFGLLLFLVAVGMAENPKEIFSIHELEMVLTQQSPLDKGNLNFQIEVIPQVKNINITNHPMPQNETAMAVNPTNTENLIVSMNDFRQGLSGQSIAYSKDGGESWNLLTVVAPENNVYYIDPSVAFDPSGNAYIAYLAVKQGAFLTGTGIAVLKSTDGGENWSTPLYIANDLTNSSVTHSRPFIAVHPTSNDIYVSWVITEGNTAYPVIARSKDGAQSFSSRVAITQEQGAVRNAIPAISLDGTVYVTYFDLLTSQIKVARSDDQGTTFQAVHTLEVEQIGEAFGYRRVLKGALKVNSYPWITVDNSPAPTSGNVYVTWADNRNGNPDIFLITSKDKGQTWSNPIRVNNDLTSADQFFPTINVDQATGAVHIAFYDSRNDAENLLVDTYVAQSIDGAETFVNTRLSTASSNPTIGFDQGSQKFFGDYLAVASFNNVIYSAFTDSREGNQEIYVAKFDKKDRPAEANVPLNYSLNQNYPNPFNPATIISFTLEVQTPVSLKIYNALGQEVVTLINNKLMEAQTHHIRFDASRLTSGVYFYRLETPNYVDTKKMMFMQ
ncbi:MAG: hypothetical protein Kow0042_10710 [Calditrichia bacterium]